MWLEVKQADLLEIKEENKWKNQEIGINGNY